MTEGFEIKKYDVPVKRYCRTMKLREGDRKFIDDYRHAHSEGVIWQEIIDGIRQVGILEMEIYILDNRLFMIVETPLDFNWDEAMARLATLPRQQEWETFMSRFQDCSAEATADEKWQMMDRMFHLY